MRATILDLRYRTKDVLKAVERGETVTVLYRGKPKARILPLSRKNAGLDSEKAFGMWKSRKDMRDPSACVRRLRGARFDYH